MRSGGMLALAAALLLAACSPAQVTPQPDAAPQPSAAASRTAGDPHPVDLPAGPIHCRTGNSDSALLAERIIATEPLLLASGTGSIAFAVRDERTGTVCSLNDSAGFPSASIIKVATLAAYLRQLEGAGLELEEWEQSLAEAAITYSDNEAQEELWLLIGGTAGLAEFLAAAGMSETTPSYADEDWGMTSVTASDQLTLVEQLVNGTLLSRAHSDYLLDLMHRVDPEQAWGVSTGAPEGAVIALKNGWVDTYPYDEFTPVWTNNSIGHVTSAQASYSMVILSTGHATDEEGRAQVNAVAAALTGALLGVPASS